MTERREKVVCDREERERGGGEMGVREETEKGGRRLMRVRERECVLLKL